MTNNAHFVSFLFYYYCTYVVLSLVVDIESSQCPRSSLQYNVNQRTFLPSGPKPWVLLGAWAILASLDCGLGKGISGFRLVSRSNSPVSVRNGDSDIVLDKDKVEVLVVVVVADICAMYYCYYVWLYVCTNNSSTRTKMKEIYLSCCMLALPTYLEAFNELKSFLKEHSFCGWDVSWNINEYNVWSIKIRTIHKLSLWLYYDFFGKSSFHIANFSCQDL